MKAVWVTAALLGLCAKAAPAPMSIPINRETHLIDMDPAISENIASDLDFHLTFIEDPLFAEGFGEYQPTLIATDLPEGKEPARIPSSDQYLRAPEPPAVAMSLAGFAFLGIFMALRRGRRQKTHGRRRRVRTYVRKMA